MRSLTGGSIAIECPALSTRRDPIVPVVNGRILASLIPKARLELIDDGHLFMISRADEVAKLICDFLTTTEPADRKADDLSKPLPRL